MDIAVVIHLAALADAGKTCSNPAGHFFFQGNITADIVFHRILF